MPVEAALNAPLFTAEVTNTRSPETIGDDQPPPGSSATHATFSVVGRRAGRGGAWATPLPPGPRNCGQGPASAPREGLTPAREAAAARAARVRGLMPVIIACRRKGPVAAGPLYNPC